MSVVVRAVDQTRYHEKCPEISETSDSSMKHDRTAASKKKSIDVIVLHTTDRKCPVNTGQHWLSTFVVNKLSRGNV